MSGLAEKIRDMKVQPGSLGLFWLGGAGFVFKTSRGKVIFVDPYLSDSANRVVDMVRMTPIPMQPEEAKLDYVVITHDHLDHLDPDTISPIAEGSNARFIGPTQCIHHLRLMKIARDRMIEMNAGDTREIEDGITITAIHAEHSITPTVGCIIDFDGIRVYHTGDTSYDKRIEKAADHHPQLALICCNGKPPGDYRNLDGDEAARLAKKLGAQVAIPMHYNLLRDTDNDPQLFVEAMKRHNVPAKTVLMDFAGSYVFRP